MSTTTSFLDQEQMTTKKDGFKLALQRSHLLNLIGKIQSIVPAKPSVPILSNILLEAYNDQLTISATDLKVSIKASAEAKVTKEGQVILSAKRFFQLIRELTSSHIELELDSSNFLQIRCGSSLFKLHTVQEEEYPPLPQCMHNASFVVHAPTLRELFERTSFAAAKEDSRHALNGMLLQLTENKMTLIATDGKRLAKINADLAASGCEGGYIIPIKAIEEMIRALDQEESAKVYIAKDKIALETSSTLIIATLLGGEYPDVSRVIPSKANMTVQLHREELASLLRQVALFTTETSHSVRFRFTSGELEISAVNSEVGEGKVSMPVDYSGSHFEIAFNPFFFIDILKHCKDETVSFGLIDSFNPGLITDQTTALFVIMPMRLS